MGKVTGIDPSSGMIESAKVPAGVELLLGCAETIPVEAETADFLCMGYALRHIADLSAAFKEFMRVLKPGGRICLLEITRPEGRVSRAVLKGYMRGIVPAVARLTSKKSGTPLMWSYYWDTIAGCAPPSPGWTSQATCTPA